MLWVVIVLIGIAVVWLWRADMRPFPNKIESPARVAGALQFLIQRGIHGGSVRFQVDMDRSRSITATKYIVSHGNVGFRSRCAQGGEPAERFTAFCQDLTERGIRHSVVTADGEQAIEVECGRDVGLGVMLVVLAFQRLFEVRLGDHCVAFFEGVAISDAASITGVDDAP